MSRPYAVFDVFSDKPLAGNQLAIVTEAADLSTEAMQSIAREFNLAETVFVLPATNPAHSARLRIFTPARELPFAGHPTVGTAVFLAMKRFGAVDRELDAVVVVEEEVGVVRCGVKLLPGGRGYAEFDVPRVPQKVGQPGDKDLVAAALGLDPWQIGFENHKPVTYNAGTSMTFVPVADLSVVRKAQPDMSHWVEAFGEDNAIGVYVYSRETLFNENDFHARFFAPEVGIIEDPATGSAVAAFAGVVKQFDDPRDGTHRYRVEQGFEMGRPSIIEMEIDVAKGQLHSVRIGGPAVLVAEGTLYV